VCAERREEVGWGGVGSAGEKPSRCDESTSNELKRGQVGGEQQAQTLSRARAHARTHLSAQAAPRVGKAADGEAIRREAERGLDGDYKVPPA
jgi:hypothetical protein